MALRTARFRPDGRPDPRRFWQTGGLAGLVLLIAPGIALIGCSPIETYRLLSGVNKNDPDPQTAPFSHNLAEGEAAPYPNFGSFPPLPTPTTNATDRQKLTQSLIAERSAVAAQAGPPPPRPANDAKAASGLPAATLAPAPAAGPSNVQSPNPAAAESPPAKTALNSVQSGRRPAGEPPEPGPLDSSMQTPEIRSLPDPETARPPPPLPVLPAVPRAVAVAEPPPAALASVAPQPAPPVPDMTPPPLPSSPVKAVPPPAPAVTTVATLEIPVNASEPAGPDRAQIARVAALYKDKGGRVRVLAYAAAPSGGGDPLDTYHAALEGAQGVAKALVDSGIPADEIRTEATPASGARAAGRVEIQFLP
jgi:hypothetical protein